jgi:putative NADPH-quinone reductase
VKNKEQIIKHFLIINGHPDKESYNYAVSEAYLKGARKTNAILTQINIADLKFKPNLEFGYSKITELEPDLLEAIEKFKRQIILYGCFQCGGMVIQH